MCGAKKYAGGMAVWEKGSGASHTHFHLACPRPHFRKHVLHVLCSHCRKPAVRSQSDVPFLFCFVSSLTFACHSPAIHYGRSLRSPILLRVGGWCISPGVSFSSHCDLAPTPTTPLFSYCHLVSSWLGGGVFIVVQKGGARQVKGGARSEKKM